MTPEEAIEMAISAMKEVRKYREIGTVEECRDAMEEVMGEFEIPKETQERIEKRIKEINGKDDASKPILSRVPPEINWAIERVREYGCRKYPEDSWKDVETQRYWEAVLRHTLSAWKDYRAVDPESGLPHIWHIACNLAFIIAQERGERK